MISFRRIVFRWLNRLLNLAGLRLERVNDDFSIQPLDNFTRERIFEKLGEVHQHWISEQQIYQPAKELDAVAEVRTFFNAWLASPFKRQTGSSRFNNLFWLYYISKTYDPKVIIDSGTYEGASAWALKLGSPEACVFSYDVDLSQVKLKVPGVEYLQYDWSACEHQWTESDRILVYFDDHVDQARRLIEAKKFACSVVIFDDDYPFTSYYAMAPNANVLPKVEFIIDDSLCDGQVFEWGTAKPGRTNRWTVNKKYLNEAKSCIDTTVRLPSTALITGIHQTPYRLVKIRRTGV